ncbi:hypothetical protein MPS_2486 [Mycobacterium pseudoshottsii JCM 15466]|nr:hypothetical protein MPS_2486 [Mycobacterium pseudoshottsii JCM 15466]
MEEPRRPRYRLRWHCTRQPRCKIVVRLAGAVVSGALGKRGQPDSPARDNHPPVNYVPP